MNGKTYQKILSAVACVSLLLNSLWGVFLYPQTVFAEEPEEPQKYIRFIEPTDGVYGGETETLDLVVEAKYEPYGIDWIMFRYAPPEESCQQQYTNPFFNQIGIAEHEADTDIYTQVWDISELESGDYTLCSLMHKNGGSEGYVEENLATVQIKIDYDSPLVPLGLHIVQNEQDLGCENYLNQRRITVDWDDNIEDDFDHYDYQIKEERIIAQPVVSEYTGDIRDEDGYYKYRVRAADTVGNVSEWTNWCGVTLDRISPSTPIIISPINNSYLRTENLTKIDWTDSEDTSLPVTYQYQAFSDENYTLNRWGPSDWLSVSEIPTPGTPEGNYYVRARAKDAAGNISDWSNGVNNFHKIVVDNTPPSIPGQIGWTTENPPEGEDYEGGSDFENYKSCDQILNYSPMTNLWAPSTDNVGVVGYERKVYNPEETQIHESTLSTSYEHGGGAVDGTTYWVRIRAFDATGNFSPWTEKCAITYDESPPLTILSSPEDNTFWDNSIPIQGTSTDDFLTDLVNLFYTQSNSSDSWLFIESINNEEEDPVFNWGPYLWTPMEGTYDIKATAIDAAGNEEESSCAYNVTFDETQPTVTNVSVDKDYVKAGDELTITADVIDASGINAVSADFSYNIGYTDRPQPTSVAMQNIGGSTYKTIYTVPSSWNEGIMYIRVAARDGTGGNWVRSNDYDSVIVDNTKPQITFEIPENESTHAGIISLRAICNEDCDYINFWWRAEGEQYSSSSKRYHYVFDNGTVFEWNLNSLDAEKWNGDTYVMEDGTYYLYAAGKDLAGNWARTLNVQIIVDNTSPNSFFTPPLDGGIFGGPGEEPIYIVGYSTDEPIETVDYTEIYYRVSEPEGEWQLLGTFLNEGGNEPFDWETYWTPGEDGTYDFKAIATDKAGNVEETAYAYGVIYDTTDPELSWTSPAGGTIISGTTVILSVATDNLSGVASVVYLYQRDDGVDVWHEIDILTSSPYETSWNTTGLALDDYNLKAVVTDKAGNSVEAIRSVSVAAVISGETWSRPEFGKITVSWTTDRPTSGRVVYDTTSHPIDLNHPNYGYANTSGTVDSSPKTTSHTVTLSELLNGITYYWRTVSTGSPIVVSREHRGDTFSIPSPPSDDGGAVAGLTTDTITTTTPFITGEIEGVSISEEEEEVLGEETTTVTSPEDLEGFGESVLGKNKVVRVILWGGATLGGLILIYFFFFRRRKRR